MNDFLSDYKTYDVDRDGFGSPWAWRKAFYKKMSFDEAKTILDEEDPFNVLNIANDATPEQIKRAFYREALKWHPDRNPNNIKQATKMMQKINAAYDLLT